MRILAIFQQVIFFISIENLSAGIFKNFKMDNYEILGSIGNGSFGTVTKVRRKSDGRVLVWKEIKYGRMSEKEK